MNLRPAVRRDRAFRWYLAWVSDCVCDCVGAIVVNQYRVDLCWPVESPIICGIEVAPWLQLEPRIRQVGKEKSRRNCRQRERFQKNSEIVSETNTALCKKRPVKHVYKVCKVTKPQHLTKSNPEIDWWHFGGLWTVRFKRLKCATNSSTVWQHLKKYYPNVNPHPLESSTASWKCTFFSFLNGLLIILIWNCARKESLVASEN